MILWKCPTPGCDQSIAIGVAIGNPTCRLHHVNLVSAGILGETAVTSSTDIHMGAKVNIGGTLTNVGKIKVYEDGSLNVSKDLLNLGDLTINDPERIKELLVEMVKTTGSVAELGTEVLKRFFGIQST